MLTFRLLTLIGLSGLLTLIATFAPAEESTVTIRVEGDRRCIMSNGTPDHAMGTFPNSGNPHSFRAQTLRYCVDAKPERGTTPTTRARTIGIALNGVPIRPETADYYDPTTPRGMSRNPASGWRYEGMDNAARFGIDLENAHVDRRGLYHYHGVGSSLATASATLLGYAADGFEIHYLGDQTTSSYRLREGMRATAPGGRHDGTFEQNWVYVDGTGDLDQCNGKIVSGRYVYVATDTYPFFPRCHWGSPSADFLR